MSEDSKCTDLVLDKLQTLDKNLDKLSSDIESTKNDMYELKIHVSKIDDIKEWKHRMEMVCTPSSLDENIKKIREINDFKIKSITIFAVAQFLLMLYLSLKK